MNPSLKPKSLVRHVKLFQFLSCYKVEQSKSEDFELDDVDDPISSSVESMMSDHVDQCYSFDVYFFYYYYYYYYY